MPEIAGQRPAPASLTRGNINDFHRPGKISQETIRTPEWRNQKPYLFLGKQRLARRNKVNPATISQRLTGILSNLS